VLDMSINVHIERLILDGLPLTRNQGTLVQAAVEAELAQLLRAGGLAPAWRSGGAVPSVRAEAIQLAGESGPAHLGQQIARAVHGGLRR
jgi:hypothetical protein